ncbi:MAG: S9 family peptidase [Massilia sp.]|nr:S9 family peptidase [Massilia sp.]
MRPFLPLVPLTLSLLAALPNAQAQYQMPPPQLQAIVDAPRTPQVALSPKRDLASMVELPALPSIADVAQPELKLAGLRINPRAYAPSSFTFGSSLKLLELASGKQMEVKGLPKSLRVMQTSWSPDQRYLAFSHLVTAANNAAVELWLVDVAALSARRLSAQPMSYLEFSPTQDHMHWMPDSKGLVVQLKPAGLGRPPAANGIPTGPNVQDSEKSATTRQLRTYPDLLKNEQDAILFEHYATSQIAYIDTSGKTRLIGVPDMFIDVEPAPNGKLILTHTLKRPFSYIVPASDFARTSEVRDLTGKVVHLVADTPLEEGLPPGNDAVSTGVRDVEWRVDAPATLVWAEAQDGGDPAKAAEVRDIVYTHPAPFTAKPEVLAKLGSRYAGVMWGRGDTALLSERWYKTRAVKTWRVQPDTASAAPELVFSYSQEDRYNSPGVPVRMADSAGHPRLVIGPDSTILLRGPGASPDGDRPFVDRFSLLTKKKERLFQSAAPYYENTVSVLSEDGTRLLTTRESPTERPNFYLRDLKKAGDAQLTTLTSFAHPTPQLKGVQKEQIRYKRADGVELTATLLLPPNYEPKRDGALPMLMWAYPAEFKSAAAASQTTGSPYKFNAISFSGPAPMLAMGYAVLDNPSMPIVGTGEAEPNDTYLPQLVADAEAAVNEVVRRGVADRHRIAIGGHSYGAFMTGNLLAHTRLFKAGIARSGAYNRSLTPFGFQSEERPYWKAMSTYQTMSPFNNADKIKDALLMIHGEQDNNTGTFPIQSERMFQAMKGLGGTARLVMLPNESHGYRARESLMHMLYETNLWLDKYVKNAKP